MKEVAQIIAFKNYSMCLRDAVEVFTKQIINNLFDVNHLLEKTVFNFYRFRCPIRVRNISKLLTP